MIELKISADSAGELSTHISDLASLLGGSTSIPSPTVTTGAATAAEVKPARRGRGKTEPVVEAKAEAPQEQSATANDADAADATAQEVNAEASIAEAEASDANATAAETSAAAEDANASAGPASPNLELFQGFDTSKAREWIIANYLNACFSTPTSRTEAFKSVVNHFGHTSLTAVPAEQLVDVLLYVETKIAEVAK